MQLRGVGSTCFVFAHSFEQFCGSSEAHWKFLFGKSGRNCLCTREEAPERESETVHSGLLGNGNPVYLSGVTRKAKRRSGVCSKSTAALCQCSTFELETFCQSRRGNDLLSVCLFFPTHAGSASEHWKVPVLAHTGRGDCGSFDANTVQSGSGSSPAASRGAIGIIHHTV